ncbi:hypothetical protein SK069_14365 [Patulibacter brassicae]|jgi:hypothetical protein|uniref:DUF4169 family protein n=1 Tax=Patulibacter brassicae TaxID=1705717 RepID=A0ABU4VLW6_9ACTN|nr:hypothetical protein [Patulibacter brassicae]MDX8152783.1 hypothetical protein [Patulibacter brassicae]
MGSNRKKKTTFAKLNREQKLRERRIEKAQRKEARRLHAGAPAEPVPMDTEDSGV